LLSVARISLALDTGREGRAGRPGAADPDAPTVRAPEAPATGAAPDPERPRTEPPA
jgi:hypothetical protein